MISKILTIIALFIIPCTGMSLAQLKEGATASVAYAAKKRLSDDEVITALKFRGYMDGFFDALLSAPQFIKGKNPELSKYMPADWMNDAQISDRNLLAFLAKHTPENVNPSKVDASNVVLSWYLWNARNTDGAARFSCYVHLLGAMGSNYPGGDEILKGPPERIELEDITYRVEKQMEEEKKKSALEGK